MVKTWSIGEIKLEPTTISTRDIQELHTRTEDNGINITYPELVEKVMTSKTPDKELKSLNKDLDEIAKERQAQLLATDTRISLEKYHEIRGASEADKLINNLSGGLNVTAIEKIKVDDSGKTKTEIPLLHADAVADLGDNLPDNLTPGSGGVKPRGPAGKGPRNG